MQNLILVHLESISELLLKTNPDLFPNIHRISEESVCYANYFSSATSTLMVVSDICYGGMFRERCNKLESNYNKIGNESSLFDELQGEGYQVKGVIWPEISTYSKIIKGKILGWDVEVKAPEEYQDFIDEIETGMDSEQPFALFIANFSSHISYRKNKQAKGKNSYILWRENCRLIDDTCAEILELLRKKKKEDNTLLVLYGDHGDDYWGHRLHNGYTHAIEPYSHIIHVPLIIKDGTGKCEQHYEMLSSLDMKEKILCMLHDREYKKRRWYIFARNIYVNQKADMMSLSKGYAVATDSYLLLVSVRGMELYNICMDPANTCNLLEFFQLDKKGELIFNKRLKQIRSWHFRDFFTEGEILHIRQIYREMRKVLLKETAKIFESAGNNINTRDKELNFYKINRYHFYQMYHTKLINLIEKRPDRRKK